MVGFQMPTGLYKGFTVIKSMKLYDRKYHREKNFWRLINKIRLLTIRHYSRKSRGLGPTDNNKIHFVKQRKR